MAHRVSLAAAASGIGMLAAALGSAAVAAADGDGGAGDAALTADYDPTGSDIDYAIDLPGLIQVGTGTGAFDLEDADGNDVGSFTDGDADVSHVLGIDTIDFTFDSADFTAAADDVDAADLPEDGTTYSIVNLGAGIQNIYEAAPGDGGETSDILVTPLGDVEIPTSLDDVVDDIDYLLSGAALADLFDDLGDGLLGGDGDGELDPDTTIASMLDEYGVDDDDFTGGGLHDATEALADSNEVYVAGGDVDADDIDAVLDDAGIGFADPGDFDAHNLADLLNGDVPSTGLDEFFDTITGDGGLLDTIADTLAGDLFGGLF